MSNIEVHFSSNSDNWGTPKDLFDRLNKDLKFDLDVCANKHNAKLKNYFDETINGLEQDWYGNCWMNPPYSKGNQKLWVLKALEEIDKDNVETVTMLLPARTDTKLYHDYIIPSLRYSDNWLCYLKGRVKFEQTVKLVDENDNVLEYKQITKTSAPFPSMIVHIGKGSYLPANLFEDLGDVRCA